MKTKPKQLGTAWESEIVELLRWAGMHPRRLAEGGQRDEGDIEFYDRTGERWVVEAKATANLNITRTLAKAKDKAMGMAPVALVWKKLTRKGDNQRRTPDGERVVVIIDWETFMSLITRRD
jgi:hypothetical protein